MSHPVIGPICPSDEPIENVAVCGAVQRDGLYAPSEACHMFAILQSGSVQMWPGDREREGLRSSHMGSPCAAAPGLVDWFHTGPALCWCVTALLKTALCLCVCVCVGVCVPTNGLLAVCQTARLDCAMLFAIVSDF